MSTWSPRTCLYRSPIAREKFEHGLPDEHVRPFLFLSISGTFQIRYPHCLFTLEFKMSCSLQGQPILVQSQLIWYGLDMSSRHHDEKGVEQCGKTGQLCVISSIQLLKRTSRLLLACPPPYFFLFSSTCKKKENIFSV